VIVANAAAELPRVALVQYLWLPGLFESSNELLSMQRGDGWWACEAKFRQRDSGRGSGRKPKVSFADRVQAIRGMANMHARSARLRPVACVDLRFELALNRENCERWAKVSGRKHNLSAYDPSGWYLAAKAIEDGLADAGLFDGDRFGVRETSGRCLRDEHEIAAAFARAGRHVPAMAVGMLVTLTETGGAVP
jgi:hypothetical protein